MDTFFAYGDAPFFFAEQLSEITWLPRLWDDTMGFGRSLIAQMWIDYPFRLFFKLAYILGFNWWSLDRILWFGALILSVFSIWKLSRYIFQSRFISSLAVCIYTFNTYSFMLFDGGQRGVMLAYSFVPFLVYRFISAVDQVNSTAKLLHVRNFQNGVLLALLISMDLRLAYLVGYIMAAYIFYDSAFYTVKKQHVQKRLPAVFLTFLPSIAIAILLHAYWILPAFFVREGISLGEEYTGVGMLSFLSVADFSHAFSFLHPNWPENIFGKVYFLQPEYLMFPLLAFGSLLWSTVSGTVSNIRYRKFIIFFCLLSLVGIFMAKGVKEPFGDFYSWVFSTIPGFVMFRDPTKFYLFIALGYSLLIPYTLRCFAHGVEQHFFQRRHKTFGQTPLVRYFVFMFFLIFWIGTLRSIFLGELKGNFAPKSVPDEYVTFKNMLLSDAEPSRVLWLPTAEKFSYSSAIHPSITSEILLHTASVSGILEAISSPTFKDILQESGIKYIVIPTDEWRRIFLTDYVFDDKLRKSLIVALESGGYSRNKTYSRLAVFQTADYVFTNQTPLYVAKQEVWMYRGLLISLISLVILTFLTVVLKRDNHDRINT